MFITLEGGEGAGKSTQMRLLAERLAASGRPTLQTREPGGAPGAEALRALLLHGDIAWSADAEAHLHFAARAEHLRQTILPALAAGMTVVCDRFADSTMAYQGFGQGVDRGLIAGLTRLLPRGPDLTLLLTVPPELGAARVAARLGGADRYERLPPDFHARVADGFAALAAAEPGRFVVCSGEGSVAEVADRLWAALAPRLSC